MRLNYKVLKKRGMILLLKLLYGWSKTVNHLKVPQRVTRAGSKIMFDIPTRCTDKYLNSPLYRGSQVRDTLSEIVQRSETNCKKSVSQLL